MMERRENVEFGLVCALATAIASAFWDISPAVLVAILAVCLLAPGLFTPFTWAWFKLAELLGNVVTRCILLVLYYAVVTPVGLLRRAAGKDALSLKRFKKGSDSVFVERETEYFADDMRRQY